MHSTTALQSLTNLKKNTLRIVKVSPPTTKTSSSSSDPTSSDVSDHNPSSVPAASSSSLVKHKIEFKFDTSAPCKIRIFFHAKEIILQRSNGIRQLAYLPKKLNITNTTTVNGEIPSAQPPSAFSTSSNSQLKQTPLAATSYIKTYGPFPAGLHQTFTLPESDVIDFRRLFASSEIGLTQHESNQLAVSPTSPKTEPQSSGEDKPIDDNDRSATDTKEDQVVPDVRANATRRQDDDVDQLEEEPEYEDATQVADGSVYYPMVIVLEAIEGPSCDGENRKLLFLLSISLYLIN
jgi:hypothetical protein